MDRLRVFFVVLSFFFAPSIVRSEDRIRIGALLPLTGAFAAIGDDCRRGLDIGTKSDRIEYVYADSQADPKVAVTEFKRLLDSERIVGAVVPRSTVGMAINPISLQRKMPILGQVAQRRFAVDNQYAFMFWARTDEEGKALAEAILKGGPKMIAVISAEDDWTLDLSDALVENFKDRGGNVVFSDTVPPKETDFSSLLAKAQQSRPDAIFLNVTLEQYPSALKRLREQNFKGSIYGNFWVGKDQQIKAAGEAAEGVLFMEVSLDRPGFRKALKDRFGTDYASAMTFWCYAAATMLTEVSSQGITSDSSDSLYQKLLSNTEIELIDGKILVKNREVKTMLALKKIQSGKVQEVR